MKAKLEQLTEANPNPVLSVAKNGTVLYSNEAGEPLLHEWGVTTGEKLPSYIEDFVQRVISQNSPEKMEVKAGKRTYLIALHPSPEEECVNAYGFDISDQKELEGKHLESENKYRNIVETSVEGIWIFDAVSETTYVNKKMAEMLGYNPEEMIGRFIWDFASVEDKDSFQIKLANRKKGIDEVYELKLIRKDGSPIWVSVSAKGFFDDSGIFEGSVGMFTDITERRRAEQELRESKARVESIFRSYPVGIGVVVNRIIKDANERLCDMTGYSREELLGKDALMLYPTAEEYERVGWVKFGMITERGTGYVETCWQRKDGSFVDILLSSSPIVRGDLSGEITFTALDITDRKHVEEALKKAHDSLEEKVKERTAELEKAYISLKESEKNLSEAQKMAHIGNWVWNIVTGKEHWSDELHRIFKRDPQEAAPSYNEYLNYVHPSDRDYVENAFNGILNGKSYEIDHRIILANGEERTVHIQAEVVFNDKNIPIQTKGTVQDITERKQAEEKIKTLAKAVETSNDAIMTGSLDGIVTSWNKGAEHIYGYSAEEIIGRSASILEPDSFKGEIKQFNEKVKRGEKIKNYETVRLRKDDIPINVSVTLSPVFDDSGRMIALSVVARDITERIKTEKLMAKAEEARKKEIHHRIKNNLQVISSLLDLQADKFNDSKVIEAFRESQNRVISMTLIHEELYKEKGTDTLDFSEDLKTLAENLFQTYILSSKNINIYTDLEKNTFFDIDSAIPLGMIVNELVSNSFKYAFQGRDKGEIRINLHREEDSDTNFVLTIADNGVGIPENLEIEELDSLGLQLVITLVDQLEGEFELKRKNGTEFIIRFTVAENNNQALGQPSSN